MIREYESRYVGDTWYPIVPEATIDGKLIQWMDENGATFVAVDLADGQRFEVRVLGADQPERERTKANAEERKPTPKTHDFADMNTMGLRGDPNPAPRLHGFEGGRYDRDDIVNEPEGLSADEVGFDRRHDR